MGIAKISEEDETVVEIKFINNIIMSNHHIKGYNILILPCIECKECRFFKFTTFFQRIFQKKKIIINKKNV